MQVTVSPLDVLFFRNGKPFDADDSPIGETIDMPYPSTFYGAFRSRVLLDNSERYFEFLEGKAGEITEVIGSPDFKGSLKINFFSLIKEDKVFKDILLPLPQDMVVKKGDKSSGLLHLRFVSKKSWIKMNNSLSHLLINPVSKQVEWPGPAYIKIKDLEYYLNNELEDAEVKVFDRMNDIFDKEYRTGIEIDNVTKLAKEKKLYRREVLRFKNNRDKSYSFFLELTGDKGLLSESGLLKLGGEQKAAEYRKVKDVSNKIELYASTKKRILKSKKFKIYLSTPTVFKRGWLPEWINPDDFTGKLPASGIRVKLLTAAVGKHKIVSGWDMAKKTDKNKRGKAKTGFRVVPEGSLYYFQILDKKFDIEELINELHGQSISDLKSKEGFGISFIGGIK
ncbi:type III-B CRISPR module-associated protein Cmr3 [Halothermothrix orenii]|uniref:CRISPR-associated protein, Cmr3 family n=1 Tax=Halothermothrix orenii (strain H 168 / OCM 544 / DSM 9562) TaxID=373903 RepID=B8CY95_HALOH|nr:type III-B CRISPR module-associated protein Cmr3 [Halothermothrix orenii]ACL70264.1 CRISPR-associated protein, Cmr3 family [Halothermothrix orenii H 168]